MTFMINEQEIRELCQLAGMPDLADKMIKDGMTAADVRAFLLAAVHGKDAVVKDALKRARVAGQ